MQKRCVQENCDGELKEIRTDNGPVYECLLCKRKFVFGMKNWQRINQALSTELDQITL